MSRPRAIVRTLVLLAAVAGAVLVWPYVQAWWQRPPLVEVTVVAREDVERVLAVTGRVRPRLRNRVVPVVGGRLVALPYDEGDIVKAGDVLGRLDDRRLAAEIAEATSRSCEAADGLKQAELDLKRARELKQKGIATGEDVDRLELLVSARTSNLAAARNREAVLQARTEDLVLRSPLAGVVLERPVDPGQTVTAGEVVYDIATVTEPWIEAEIDERFLGELQLGQSARLAAAGRRDQVGTAELALIGGNVNRLSGAVLVRLRLRDPDTELAVGQTLDVNVRIAEHPQAVVVSRAAVESPEGEAWVLVAEPADVPGQRRLVRRDITVIDWPAADLVVLNGLEPGDQVVAEPRASVPGEIVRTNVDVAAARAQRKGGE